MLSYPITYTKDIGEGLPFEALFFTSISHQHVIQPLLLEQLLDLGIDISRGQLSHLLTKDLDEYHAEKADILRTGLKLSSYTQADDTGARHAGETGYCTHIGNELFAWFESTASKSRINSGITLLTGQEKQNRFLLLRIFFRPLPVDNEKLPLHKFLSCTEVNNNSVFCGAISFLYAVQSSKCFCLVSSVMVKTHNNLAWTRINYSESLLHTLPPLALSIASIRC